MRKQFASKFLLTRSILDISAKLSALLCWLLEAGFAERLLPNLPRISFCAILHCNWYGSLKGSKRFYKLLLDNNSFTNLCLQLGLTWVSWPYHLALNCCRLIYSNSVRGYCNIKCLTESTDLLDKSLTVFSFLVRWFIYLFSGQKDSSGITLYYTDKLRKYDLGIVAVGSQPNPWFVIPPKQKNWTTEGYCMHQCTEVSSERSFKALNMIWPSLLQWNSSMK